MEGKGRTESVRQERKGREDWGLNCAGEVGVGGDYDDEQNEEGGREGNQRQESRKHAGKAIQVVNLRCNIQVLSLIFTRSPLTLK